MNGKQFPICPDCGYVMLPKPTEERDGCLLKPLVCAFCECEKDVIIVQVILTKPDDLPGQAVQS